MQMDVRKTLYFFYTTKKMTLAAAKSQKLHIVAQQCFFFTNASFHAVQNYMDCGYQQLLSFCNIYQDVCV